MRTLDDLLRFQRRRYKETRAASRRTSRASATTRLPLLPDRPGVYFMRDGKGKVIYIGKAKSLKSRVRSYFTGVENHPPKTKKLLRDVRDVTWRETGTELSALLEESRLIKTYLPVYNRALRRYRDYPFLRLDTQHAFPTISWTPRIAHDGAEYYGPLARRGQADELVELIGRMFGLRECDDPVFRLGRPCLYHQMGRCSAPCVGDDGTYAEQVERVRAFLTGQNGDALAERRDGDARRGGGPRVRVGRVVPGPAAAAPARDRAAADHRLGRPRARRRPRRAARAGLRGRGGGAQLFLIRHGRLAARVDLGADPGPDEAADLAASLAETFDPALPLPEAHGRPDVDQMRMVASWMRLHPTRQVRWTDTADADAFLDEVLAAAASVAPDDAPPVGEDDD